MKSIKSTWENYFNYKQHESYLNIKLFPGRNGLSIFKFNFNLKFSQSSLHYTYDKL